MSIVNGLRKLAATYSDLAARAENLVTKDPPRASYLTGRAEAFRQAAFDVRMVADLAEEPENKADTPT